MLALPLWRRAQKARADRDKALGGSAAKIQALYRGHAYRKTAVKPKKVGWFLR